MKKRAFAAALALTVWVAAPRADVIEQILVKVNGEIFTKTDLEARQVTAIRQRGQQLDLKADAGNAQLRKLLDDLTPQLMVDVVDEMILLQRGRELGYKLSDDQFKTAVDNIKRDNKLDDDAFQAALKQENLTMNDLRRNLERSMIVQRVQQNEVFGKIAVTDEEARKYYDAHQNEFTTPPSITVREITINVPTDARGVNVAAEDAGKSRIDVIRGRAVSGEAFEQLAMDFSDSPSRTVGGLVGPLSVADLDPSLQTIIAALKVGDISQPFRTARGFQMLKLESSTPTVVMPFDQAKERISDRVFTDKRKAEFQKYLEKSRAQAIIEWKNEDVRKAYEAGVKQVAAEAAAPSEPAPAPPAR